MNSRVPVFGFTWGSSSSRVTRVRALCRSQIASKMTILGLSENLWFPIEQYRRFLSVARGRFHRRTLDEAWPALSRFVGTDCIELRLVGTAGLECERIFPKTLRSATSCFFWHADLARPDLRLLFVTIGVRGFVLPIEASVADSCDGVGQRADCWK